MALEFTLPMLGENVTQGVVVRVAVGVGDTVAEDDPILEVETDKAIAEVPATFAGKITQVHVKEGDEVEPGQVIVSYDAEQEAASAQPDDEPAEDAGEEAPQPAGEEPAPAGVDAGADSGAGPAARADAGAGAGADVGAGAEAGGGAGAQTAVQTPPDRAGEISAGARSMAAAPDVQVGTGQPDDPAESRRSQHAAGDERPVAGQPPARADRLTPEAERALLPAAPSTRRFAREIGIDLREVTGTGPGGRISIEDVKAYAKKRNEGAPGVGGALAVSELPLPDLSRWGEIERKPMSGIRRITAERLSAVWATVPHVTQFDDADVTELEQLRRKFSPKVEAKGAKLTVTAILLKVIAGALKVFPQFNASVDMPRREIVYKKYIHIGVAVDTEHGLMVPVIRDVDSKNLIELSLELSQIAEKTRARRITADEMQGGSFTISNLGGIGGTGFTPIINPPEVAILGVARTQTRPVYVDGEFVPRQILPLALSYDHRVIDGADGIRFLRWVVEALENPFLLTLEG